MVFLKKFIGNNFFFTMSLYCTSVVLKYRVDEGTKIKCNSFRTVRIENETEFFKRNMQLEQYISRI